MIDEQTRATLSTLRGALAGNATFVQAAADVIQDLLDGEEVPVPQVPWTRDISSELARNPGPYGHRLLKRDNGWWKRTLDQINAVTIHHTMSDSPHVVARNSILKHGGIPSIQYSIWVTQTGEILLCVPLEEAPWHDACGHENKHLSVGMAGRLHEYMPSDVQLDAVARVCKWAIQSDILLDIVDISQIKGDMDWRATACPGWLGVGEGRPSGYWKASFYNVLESVLA